MTVVVYEYGRTLEHYGVKGMKWGVRRTAQQVGTGIKWGYNKSKQAVAGAKNYKAKRNQYLQAKDDAKTLRTTFADKNKVRRIKERIKNDQAYSELLDKVNRDRKTKRNLMAMTVGLVYVDYVRGGPMMRKASSMLFKQATSPQARRAATKAAKYTFATGMKLVKKGGTRVFI